MPAAAPTPAPTRAESPTPAVPQPSPLLGVRGLRLGVAGRRLVDDLDLDVHGGENWAVLGPNGAGKSTLLRCLAGLAPPQAGSLTSEGDDLAAVDDRERARRIGILLQEDETVFPASVLDTVMIGRHPHLGRWQWESADDRTLALAALRDVELEAFAARDVTTLSGGERRRAAIAAVLAQQPRLGLWDEPLNHLDPRHQRRILGRLAARAGQPGQAGVFVLHDVNLAVRHCTHALLLHGDGRTASGPIDELLDADRLGDLYAAPIRALRDGDRVWYVFD